MPDDPYRAPSAHTPLPAPTAFQWKRVAAWALVIYASGMAVGLGFGFSAQWWLHLGDDPAETVTVVRRIRMCTYFAMYVLLYWRFATGIASRPWLHAGMLFVLLHGIDYAIAVFAFHEPLRDLVKPASTGKHLLAAAIGRPPANGPVLTPAEGRPGTGAP